MKKLYIIILILFLGKLSYGQFPNGVQQDNPATLRQFNGGIKALNGFIPPTLDTLNNPAATYYGALTTSPLYPGKLFMSIQTRWVEVSGSTNISFPNTVHKYLTGYDGIFGTLNTDSITEASNLFYTTARARSAISVLSPLVYNSTTGVASADTTILATKTDVATGIATRWSLTGNAGTTSSSFIGTTDNVPLRFKINSSPYGIIGLTTNTSIGFNALHSVSSGTTNTAFGYAAGALLTTGTDNTAVGVSALSSTTNGAGNSAFGLNSLLFDTSGAGNSAFGLNSLGFNSNGSYNSAFGGNALVANTTGSVGVAFGAFTLSHNTTGSSNTGVGSYSLLANSTGSFNTAIGDSTLATQTTGTRNVALGHGAGYNETTSNKLYIANSTTTVPLIYGNFSNRNVSINSGASADTSYAVFSIADTAKGVLFPRMNTVQAWKIGGGKTLSNIPVGLIVYNNDSTGLCIKLPGVDSIWGKLGSSSGGGPVGGVSSVATGYGLSGGTITATGTLILDSATLYLTALRRKDSTLYATLYQNSLKQNAITLTTTGTSGASTLVGSTLNIPQYAGGSPNVNVGSGFRLTFPATNNVRTLFNGYATLLDSTTNTNGITFKSDTTLVATRLRVAQAIADSNAANTFTIAHAGISAGYDSLFYIIDATHIKFVKLTGGSSPIVLTQGSDTSIGFSMPSFAPVSGKTLTLDNSIELAGTDGTVMTFPVASATVGGLGTNQTWSGENTFSSSSAANNTMNRLRSGATNAQSNIVWQSPASISNQTDATSVPTGIAGLSYRVNFAGVNSTMSADYIYANVNLAKVGVTSATSNVAKGATNLLAQSPVFTASGAGAKTNTLSNVYIYGKPSYTNADTAVSLLVKGTALFTDTVRGLTMGTADASNAYATDAFVHAAITAGGAPTFNDVAEQSISTTVTWAGTAPTGANTNTYRWTQIGNHVTARFNLGYAVASAGTSSQVTIVLPLDMPSPEKPTGFTTGTDYTTIGSGMLSTTKNAVSSERGRAFIQWDGTNFNLIVKITTAVAVQYGYAVIDYWIP